MATVRGDSVGPDLASGGDRRRRSRRRCPCGDELDGLRGAAAGTVLVLGVSRTTPDDGREDGHPSRLAIAAVAVAGDADERMAIFRAGAPTEPLIPS